VGDNRVSDVGNGNGDFDPWPDTAVHVEWGVEAAMQGAQRGDVVVVVDVLSFSTTVCIALEQGASVLALSAAQIEAMGGRDVVAKRFDAHIVAKRRDDPKAKFTLSPASVGRVDAGDKLVLTSLNGAAMVAAGASGRPLLTGSLRSASATAQVAARQMAAQSASRITIVASAEHWSSVSPGVAGIRPSIEDQIGAGAVSAGLANLGLELSAEADAAAALFTATSNRMEAMLFDCVSGRELVAGGFARDVELAAQIDVTNIASLQDPNGFFVSTA